jgi:hypothetical protein
MMIRFMKKTSKCSYEAYTLFTDHTYTFRLSSVTILRVYSIKEYNKSRVCGESVQDLLLYYLILYTLRKVAEDDQNT